MIIAEFNFIDKYSFQVKGHAESGPYGHDLVCAATSGIVSGILNVLDSRYNEDLNILIEDNKIKVTANKINDKMLQDFETLLIQLKTLEIQYPKNIKIKEVR